MNTTGATGGVGTAYPSEAPVFTPVFCGFRISQFFIFCEMFCRSLFLILFFFCCLAVIDLQLPFIHLVYSTLSY
jgi:hypothetical protein